MSRYAFGMAGFFYCFACLKIALDYAAVLAYFLCL